MMTGLAMLDLADRVAVLEACFDLMHPRIRHGHAPTADAALANDDEGVSAIGASVLEGMTDEQMDVFEEATSSPCRDHCPECLTLDPDDPPCWACGGRRSMLTPELARVVAHVRVIADALEVVRGPGEGCGGWLARVEEVASAVHAVRTARPSEPVDYADLQEMRDRIADAMGLPPVGLVFPPDSLTQTNSQHLADAVQDDQRALRIIAAALGVERRPRDDRAEWVARIVARAVKQP